MATSTIDINIDPVESRPALLATRLSLSEITDKITRPLETPPPRAWYIAFAIGLGLLSLFGLSVAWLFWEGVGIWGNNIPVGWGWPIVNFVFWVGIAHAGTLISAVLFLFRQRWRTSINRAAEARLVATQRPDAAQADTVIGVVFRNVRIGRRSF